MGGGLWKGRKHQSYPVLVFWATPLGVPQIPQSRLCPFTCAPLCTRLLPETLQTQTASATWCPTSAQNLPPEVNLRGLGGLGCEIRQLVPAGRPPVTSATSLRPELRKLGVTQKLLQLRGDAKVGLPELGLQL